ncbi:hypothetical protein B0H34DRAFT_24380 [Crassisporium funariophilum]|nr:hypothetical protein B0H34DRAFT_24380 [Crassisporium funariophilum]
MIPQLPLDVFVKVLSFLPASRARCDIGSTTLAHCLETSCLLREAASVPSIWQSHYQLRYEHCDEDNEHVRMEGVDNNWRLLYQQRRQLDLVALQYLDKMVTLKVGQTETARSLFRLGMDVWDALELESLCPIPELFAGEGMEFSGGSIPDHAITRRFWAKSMLDTISRGHAIGIWQRFWTSQPEKPSFEETISALSCFFGTSEERLTAQLDALANECCEALSRRGVPLDPSDKSYDTSAICMEICTFMQGRGFVLPSGQEFNSVLHNYPHAYLSTNKKTIPICLVHVFVAIGSRLHLNASPINFPGTVLAYVLPPGAAKPIIVNPSASSSRRFIIDPDLQDPIMQMVPSNVLIPEYFQPCTGMAMLLRASRNVLASIVATHEVPRGIVHPSVLMAACVHLLFQADDRTVERLFLNITLQPLDCIFLLDSLAPCLIERCKTLIERHCQAELADAATTEGDIHSRVDKPVKYFVGMAFVHARYGYLGFIYGWDKTCNATEEWMSLMKVDALRRGRFQPFYNVFSDDGAQRYVAEENIQPAAFTREHIQAAYQRYDDFPTRFQGAEIPEEPSNGIDNAGGRGRLLMSPHTLHIYPHDNEVGALWVKEGLLPS